MVPLTPKLAAQTRLLCFWRKSVFGDLAVAAYAVPRVWPSVGGKGRKSAQCGGFKNNDCGCDIFLKSPVKISEGHVGHVGYWNSK